MLEVLKADSSTRKTVLIVEDDAGLRKLLRLVVESAGVDVRTAESGAEAVQQDLTECDAVFLDIHLPDARGEKVAERLRASGYGGRVIALTADARLVEQETVADDGSGPFDGWIDKAVSPDQLLRKILPYLRDGGIS